MSDQQSQERSLTLLTSSHMLNLHSHSDDHHRISTASWQGICYQTYHFALSVSLHFFSPVNNPQQICRCHCLGACDSQVPFHPEGAYQFKECLKLLSTLPAANAHLPQGVGPRMSEKQPSLYLPVCQAPSLCLLKCASAVSEQVPCWLPQRLHA